MEFYGMSGERLGTIGQPKPPSPPPPLPATTAVLPQWKKDFLQKPSISVRKGIAWVSSVGFIVIIITIITTRSLVNGGGMLIDRWPTIGDTAPLLGTDLRRS